MAFDVYELTLTQNQTIEKMFYGPYEGSWYSPNGRVENSDEAIALRLDIPSHVVSRVIDGCIKHRIRRKFPLYIEIDDSYPDYIILTFESKMNNEEIP